MSKDIDLLDFFDKANKKGVGGPDSFVEVYDNLMKLLSVEAYNIFNENNEKLLLYEILHSSAEKLSALSPYSGLAQNLAIILRKLGDAASEDGYSKPDELTRFRKCIRKTFIEYVLETLLKISNYCSSLDGDLLIISRGLLAGVCAIASYNSRNNNTVKLFEGVVGNPLLDNYKLERVGFLDVIKMIKKRTIRTIVAQVELISYQGIVASLGSIELSILTKKYLDSSAFQLLDHPLSATNRELPPVAQLSKIQVKAPALGGEDYPWLDVAQWEIVPGVVTIFSGIRGKPAEGQIESLTERAIDTFISRVRGCMK